MSYTIALAGNPNSGKTTVFNTLTGSRQHVGNWPGVTVDKKEGVYRKNKDMKILDLPGTYSLSPYSAEEVIARNFIVNERPDCVVDILDGTSLERNLYLALQIMETGIPTVLGINMMDEVTFSKDVIDFKRLEAEFGVEVIPLEARSGKGIDALMEAVTRTIKEKRFPKRLPVYDLSKKVDEDTLADKRYSLITEVVGSSVRRGKKDGEHTQTRSDTIDKVLTH